MNKRELFIRIDKLSESESSTAVVAIEKSFSFVAILNLPVYIVDCMR